MKQCLRDAKIVREAAFWRKKCLRRVRWSTKVRDAKLRRKAFGAYAKMRWSMRQSMRWIFCVGAFWGWLREAKFFCFCAKISTQMAIKIFWSVCVDILRWSIFALVYFTNLRDFLDSGVFWVDESTGDSHFFPKNFLNILLRWPISFKKVHFLHLLERLFFPFTNLLFFYVYFKVW